MVTRDSTHIAYPNSAVSWTLSMALRLVVEIHKSCEEKKGLLHGGLIILFLAHMQD